MRITPILLDAEAPVSDAVRRLEANRLWPAIGCKPAQEWIAYLAETLGISTTEAARSLERTMREAWAAIRREAGSSVLWFALPVSKVFDAIGSQGPTLSLAEALDLRALEPVPTMDVGKPDRAKLETFQGLLMDGDRPIACQSGVDDPHPARRTIRGIEFGGSPGKSVTSRPAPAVSPPYPRPRGPEVSTHLSALPRIQSPERVSPNEDFVLSIGLAPLGSEPALGPEMRIPLPRGEKSFTLDIQVVADGFKAPRGWRHSMQVATEHPWSSTLAVPLRAPDLQEGRDLLLTSIVVLYVVNGAYCGHGVRRLVVLSEGARLPAASPNGMPWLEDATSSGAVVLGGTGRGADIEIMIAKPDQNASTGRYSVTFSSPHRLALPSEPLEVDLGMDAASYAKGMIDAVSMNAGSRFLERELRGRAKSLGDILPPAFWQPIRAAADMVKAVPGRSLPSLLLISAEPYIPWELAVMERPLDSGAPPYLGVQTIMGRWLMTASGHPRPPYSQVDVSAMATMVGYYGASSGLNRLPMAEMEGATLTDRYHAVALAATEDDLLRLLDARLDPDTPELSGAEAIHIAAHGTIDPREPGSAAVFLNNRRPVTPFIFRDAAIGTSHEPFIFLNACMVGTAGELLGGCGGYPNACLLAGFRALIAPLWAVADGVAHDLALEFYQRAFGSAGVPPEPVGSILRDFRCRASAAPPATFEATYLAYVFYGHPNLTLCPIRELAATIAVSSPT